jgi:hypothetical protein
MNSLNHLSAWRFQYPRVFAGLGLSAGFFVGVFAAKVELYWSLAVALRFGDMRFIGQA